MPTEFAFQLSTTVKSFVWYVILETIARFRLIESHGKCRIENNGPVSQSRWRCAMRGCWPSSMRFATSKCVSTKSLLVLVLFNSHEHYRSFSRRRIEQSTFLLQNCFRIDGAINQINAIISIDQFSIDQIRSDATQLGRCARLDAGSNRGARQFLFFSFLFFF
jgi:hypothetical protein